MTKPRSYNSCPFLLFCNKKVHVSKETCILFMRVYYSFGNRFCCPECGYSYRLEYSIFWALHGHHAGFFEASKKVVGLNRYELSLNTLVTEVTTSLPPVSVVPEVEQSQVQSVQDMEPALVIDLISDDEEEDDEPVIVEPVASSIPPIPIPITITEMVSVGTMTDVEAVSIGINTLPLPSRVGTMTDPMIFPTTLVTKFKEESRIVIELSDDEDKVDGDEVLTSAHYIEMVETVRGDLCLTPSISGRESSCGLESPCEEPAEGPLSTSSLPQAQLKPRPVHTNPNINLGIHMDDRLVSLGKRLRRLGDPPPTKLGLHRLALKRMMYCPPGCDSTDSEKENVKGKKIKK